MRKTIFSRKSMSRSFSSIVAFMLVILLVFLNGGGTYGSEEENEAVSNRECGAEIRSLCPRRFSFGSISRCIEKKRDQLSPKCQAFWDEAVVCHGEIQVVCDGVFPLLLPRCIRKNTDRFSQMCQKNFQSGE